mmetsp:Transcript_19992/g.36169  ORF Transcript_19992/g.36169 Transcript_19992/m.36169 type:complete len:299 (-) Transcript_19992:6-902(-)
MTDVVAYDPALSLEGLEDLEAIDYDVEEPAVDLDVELPPISKPSLTKQKSSLVWGQSEKQKEESSAESSIDDSSIGNGGWEAHAFDDDPLTRGDEWDPDLVVPAGIVSQRKTFWEGMSARQVEGTSAQQSRPNLKSFSSSLKWKTRPAKQSADRDIPFAHQPPAISKKPSHGTMRPRLTKVPSSRLDPVVDPIGASPSVEMTEIDRDTTQPADGSAIPFARQPPAISKKPSHGAMRPRLTKVPSSRLPPTSAADAVGGHIGAAAEPFPTAEADVGDVESDEDANGTKAVSVVSYTAEL